MRRRVGDYPNGNETRTPVCPSGSKIALIATSQGSRTTLPWGRPDMLSFTASRH
jgi:hypothetical protein